MLATVVRLSDDAAGLEKLLRLGQYVSQASAASLMAAGEPAKSWKQAHAQFGLARRYFRLLKWHGSLSIAHRSFHSDRPPLEKMFRVSKWSFLALYFFFEMFTITDAMKVTNTEWGPLAQREATKFWLYAIVSSILLSVVQLLSGVTALADKRQIEADVDEKTSSRDSIAVQNAAAAAYSQIYVQFATDCADVLVPGALLGWLPIDDVYVGIAGTVSTLLAFPDILGRM